MRSQVSWNISKVCNSLFILLGGVSQKLRSFWILKIILKYWFSKLRIILALCKILTLWVECIGFPKGVIKLSWNFKSVDYNKREISVVLQRLYNQLTCEPMGYDLRPVTWCDLFRAYCSHTDIDRNQMIEDNKRFENSGPCLFVEHPHYPYKGLCIFQKKYMKAEMKL